MNEFIEILKKKTSRLVHFKYQKIAGTTLEKLMIIKDWMY